MLKSKMYDYASNTAKFVSPYIKDAGEYVTGAAKLTGKKLNNQKKKIKRHMRITKIKRILDFTTNAVLLAASVVALVLAVGELLKSKDN